MDLLKLIKEWWLMYSLSAAPGQGEMLHLHQGILKGEVICQDFENPGR